MLSLPPTLTLPSPTKLSLQMVANGLEISAPIRLAARAALDRGTETHLICFSPSHPLCLSPHCPRVLSTKITALPNSVCLSAMGVLLHNGSHHKHLLHVPPPSAATTVGSITSLSSVVHSSATMRHHLWMGDKVKDGDSSVVVIVFVIVIVVIVIVVIVIIVAALCSKCTRDCQQCCCQGGHCKNFLAEFFVLRAAPVVLVGAKRWLMVFQEWTAEEGVEWRQEVVGGEDL